MAKLTLVKALVALACVGALPGCSAVTSRVGAYLAANKNSAPAAERVYGVHWWARADETFNLPFQPIELGSPEVDPKSGSAFVVTADGRVRAFDRMGRTLWVYETSSNFDAGPTYADGRLYVASAKGKLLALDATSGRLIWSYAAGDELVTRPTTGGGLVFAFGASDTLFAIDQQTGTWKWQYRRESQGEFSIRGAARPLFMDGRVYAGFADGFAVCLDALDGSLRWAKDLALGKPYADVDAGPLADGEGHVYFASFATGLYSLDRESGTPAWSVNQPGITSLAIDSASGRIYAGGAGDLRALELASGALRWRLALGAERSITGLGLANNLILAATGSGPMLFIEASTGELRRTFNPGRGISASPTTGPGQALVLSNRGYLYALDIVAWGRR
jgi:outer membrane protein assembly factor BamB